MFLTRLKHREVTLFKRRNIRSFVGALLGLAAGASLTTTIIPTAVSALVGGEHFVIRYLLADYFAHTALVWAVGGWSAARFGAPLPGAVVLGALGMASGFLLALACLGKEPAVLLAAAGGAMVYGAVGGLIVSGIMPGDDDRLMINFDKRL